MISHKYRFICPRIGKNASSTLVEYFRQFDKNLIDEGHESVLGSGFAAFLESPFMGGQDHRGYYKFAFARNPYDRLVSAFHENQNPASFRDIKTLVNNDKDFILQNILTDFSEFVRMSLKYPHIHWKSQHEMIHYDNKILVHYVGHVETIRDDIDQICKRVGINNKNVEIPVVRKSPQRKHYSSYYSSDLIEIVKKIYKKDLEYFKYTFEEDKNVLQP